MASSELRLNVPIDQAREAIAGELAAQGFTVESGPSGSLEVTRGSLGTTLVAGAFSGQDIHVKFGVDLAATETGTRAEVRSSGVAGFLKGGAIGATKANDIVQEASHRLGAGLSARGLLEGQVPAAAAVSSPGATDPYAAPPAAAYATGAAPAAAGFVPPPVDYANRTNIVAIFALILGFLFPIGGIIAGAVALAQVKRTGEKGRGLALAGIIVGSVVIVLGIVLVSLLTFFGLQAARDEAAATDPFTSQTDPDGSEVVPTDPEAESVDVFTLQVGDCLNDAGVDEVTNVEVVDCAAPHDYEVFTEFAIPGDEYPGLDGVDTAATDGCYAAFPGFVGLAYEESTLDFSYFSPTEESWQNDDRLVSCLIYDPAGQASGSLAAVAR